MQTTLRVLLGAIAAGALLAGCGSTASSAAPPPSAASSAPPSAGQAAGGGGAADLTCGLAPASLVGSALGVTGVGAPRQTVSTTQGTECIYTSSSGPVTLIMFNDATAAKMTVQQQIMGKGEHVSPDPGFEDQAFSTSQDGASTLVARKGSVQFTVSALVSVSAEKALEEQLFAKVG